MKPEKKQLDAFKKDLKILLNKHSASLGLSIEGDTHGIYDEGLDVSFLLPLEKGKRFRQSTECEKLAYGYSIAANDIF